MSEVKVKHHNAGIDLKSAPAGQVSAVIASLGVIDNDGDIAFAESFTDGEEVIISPWNHSSMGVGGQLPVGKGRIRVTPTEVLLDGEWFMANATARESFEVIRSVGASMPWSYGYLVESSEPITWEGKSANHLKKVHVYEASPVSRAAGIATRTLAAKDAEAKEIAEREHIRFILERWRLPGSNRDAEAREIAAQEMARFYLSLAAA
jgi:hypothetical protein